MTALQLCTGGPYWTTLEFLVTVMIRVRFVQKDIVHAFGLIGRAERASKNSSLSKKTSTGSASTS